MRYVVHIGQRTRDEDVALPRHRQYGLVWGAIASHVGELAGQWIRGNGLSEFSVTRAKTVGFLAQDGAAYKIRRGTLEMGLEL
jgi:hypothetical protein